MEKDALELILNEIDSLDLGKFKFVHDCDIQADSLVMKKCRMPKFYMIQITFAKLSKP